MDYKTMKEINLEKWIEIILKKSNTGGVSK